MGGPKESTYDQTPEQSKKFEGSSIQLNLHAQKNLIQESQFERVQRKKQISLNNFMGLKKQLSMPHTLRQVYEFIETSAILIDNNCQPESFNNAFSLLVGTNDKFIIQNILKSIQIFSIDKTSRLQLKMKKSEQLQQSARTSIFSLPQLIKIQSFAQKSIITEFKSDSIYGSFQIEIFPRNGLYLLTFTNVEDFEKYLIKRTTDSLMNQIFRSFSHEFSTSLNAIQTIGHASQNNLKYDQIYKKYIDPILNSAQILKFILSDIKDFSLILSKNLSVTADLINLKQVVHEVYRNYSSQLDLKGISFESNAEVLYLTSDEHRISQILNNLLSNAQKFSDKGIIKVDYFDEIIQEIRYVKISVEDQGHGMDYLEIERLNEFLENDLSKSKKNGLHSFGIGLLISNQIAIQLSQLKRSQGGGINFESQEGVGSKFWFRVLDLNSHVKKIGRKYNQITQNRCFKAVSLRASEESNYNLAQKIIQDPQNNIYPENQISIKSRSESEYSFDPNSENRGLQYCQIKDHFVIRHPNQKCKCKCSNVLIVDDEYINIYALQLLLQSFNLQSDSASNGYEGANKVINRINNPCKECQIGYKYIIMDIEMPIWNGLKAAQVIKQFCEEKDVEIPYIIACTAYVDQNTQLKCQQAGMSFFLPKPIAKLDLKEALSFQ